MVFNILSSLYNTEGPERVGFITKDNEIIEVPNVCQTPTEGFVVDTQDIIKYSEVSIATWHTHPSASSNLSNEDDVLVKNWPHLLHYIIGKDGVRCFYYDDKKQATLEKACE